VHNSVLPLDLAEMFPVYVKDGRAVLSVSECYDKGVPRRYGRTTAAVSGIPSVHGYISGRVYGLGRPAIARQAPATPAILLQIEQWAFELATLKLAS
jgi:hypothetical protein